MAKELQPKHLPTEHQAIQGRIFNVFDHPGHADLSEEGEQWVDEERIAFLAHPGQMAQAEQGHAQMCALVRQAYAQAREETYRGFIGHANINQ